MARTKTQEGPEKETCDPYQLSEQEEANYTQMFQKLDTEDGHLDGKKAVILLCKSGLPQERLAEVWTLSDQDCDGKLSLKEFCVAMHLVGCVRKKGMPLPEFPTVGTRKKTPKRVKSGSPGENNITKVKGQVDTISPQSPKRLSRFASLVGKDQPVEATQGAGLPNSKQEGLRKNHELSVLQREEEQVSTNVNDYSHGKYVTQILKPAAHQNYPPEEHTPNAVSSAGSLNLNPLILQEVENLRPATVERVKSFLPEQAAKGVVKHQAFITAVETKARAEHGGHDQALTRQHRPKLRQLNANDVDAIFAEGQGAINSLRDVQSWRVLVMGLHRLAAKDVARGEPVNIRARRRHTLPQVIQGELARKKDFLPGRGRRTSLLANGYEPAAAFLMQRAERRSAREMKLEKEMAKAAIKWNLKPLPEFSESGEHVDETEGDLNVAGLPLLDEDIDIIVHLLRQNLRFKKLDLSKCFLSDKNFLALTQALAWNCRVEEVCLKGCVFTDVGTAALADVLTINNYIQSIDIRDCQGLKESGLKEILMAAGKKSKLLYINGMELAALRAEGSDILDLSGRKLGYVEAIVVAYGLGKRANGLQRVDFHNNLLSTLCQIKAALFGRPALTKREAFMILAVALQKQTSLLSLDLNHNQIDERILPDIAKLLCRNTRLSDVNLAKNNISCTEFEHFGLDLMRLLSSNNIVTVFDVDDNPISPKMVTAIAEKLAANRAVRRDMTFVECLHLKYPRTALRPVLADPRKLHLQDVDVHFMTQEGISAMRATARTEQEAIVTLDGVKSSIPLDLYFLEKRDTSETPGGFG